MIFEYACIKCAKEFKVIGSKQETKQIDHAHVEELPVTKEKKHYKIKTVRCPYCGHVHTVQIDSKDTQALVRRVESLFVKKVIAEDASIDTRKGKRLRKAYIDTNEALKRKRIILNGWADGQSFDIDGTNKQIVYKYIIYMGNKTHEIKR